MSTSSHVLAGHGWILPCGNHLKVENRSSVRQELKLFPFRIKREQSECILASREREQAFAIARTETELCAHTSRMKQGMAAPPPTFVDLLERCLKDNDSTAAREERGLTVRSGFQSDAFPGARMCALFESLLEEEVFSELSKPNLVLWTAIIAAHAKLGRCEQMIKLFKLMQNLNIRPDGRVFIVVLKACSSILSIDQGELVHSHIIESGFESHSYVGSALIDMYAKCGHLDRAHLVFQRLPQCNIVAWSALITGYAEHELGEKALKIFEQSLQKGLQPDRVTFICILKACSSMASPKQGWWIHARIIEHALEWARGVGNSLIDMYGKCGSLQDAQRVFGRLPQCSVVSWSALIASYAQHGHGQKALLLFQQMQQVGLEPNPVTFACILKACSSIAAINQGRGLHSLILRYGLESQIYIGNTLIDMYAKCGSLEDARKVFIGLPKRDIVTWNALIAGYAHGEHGHQALELFEQMQQDGVKPNTVTYVCVLKACSGVAAINQGRLFHAQIVERVWGLDMRIGNSLIDMYAKCGSLEEAELVFQRLPKQDRVTWNTLIVGYAYHNNYDLAFQYFMGMQQKADLKPDEVSFLGLLLACCHVGLVDEGRLHFKGMQEDYGIIPRLEHYDSLVELFGQAGHLEKAEDLLETIPFQANIVGWTSLLSSRRVYSKVDLAKRCFDHIVELDHGSAVAYMLMSNIYNDAGMQADANRIEDLRRCVNGWKKPARAFIDINNQVHDFVVGDKIHPRIDDVYAKLKSLNKLIREEGYKPHLDLILNPSSDKGKEEALCGHCEKLAIALGLICTPRGTTIRVSKNLRMCADCHSATKLISKIELREIVVISAHHIHQFLDGKCSCKE